MLNSEQVQRALGLPLSPYHDEARPTSHRLHYHLTPPGQGGGEREGIHVTFYVRGPRGSGTIQCEGLRGAPPLLRSLHVDVAGEGGSLLSSLLAGDGSRRIQRIWLERPSPAAWASTGRRFLYRPSSPAAAAP